MIPDFVHHADAPATSAFLLPPGIWPCTLPEIERTLVRPYIASRTRASIFGGLQFYLRDCQQLGIGGRVWIDGSFVTGKTDPADIDLISVVPSEALIRLSQQEQVEAQELLNGGAATKSRYDVHSFNAVALPDSNGGYLDNARKLMLALHYFGETKPLFNSNRQQVQLAKGLLQVDFGNQSDIDRVARWFDIVKEEAKSWN